jgi:AraC family transcriptional regulator
MTMQSRLLASGRGWTAHDTVCCAGPHDRPFEERHDLVCIAAVTEGTFEYRTAHGKATLVPGSLLLGNAGSCFECSHEHATGDRCLSLHFAQGLIEDVAASMPGIRRATFAQSRLPPSPRLLALIAEALAAHDDAAAIEEIVLRMAATAIACAAGESRSERAPSGRDRRRITDAIRRIEMQSEEPLTLAELAAGTGMSAYHFLRTFRQVTGTTPHQFLLMRRLNAAADRLRRTDLPVGEIAYASGFGDLSTFNRRFRHVIGMSPRDYRRARQHS